MVNELTESQPRARSIAILCFLPDFGHVQPLLKIADALSGAGFKIKCYVPEECSVLMNRFSFEYMLLDGAQLSEGKKILASIFARSIFFNSFSAYVHLNLFQAPHVFRAIGQSAERLKSALIEQRPDFIISDAYLFGQWYARIATFLRVPIVMHHVYGSLIYNQREFVRAYGITATPPFLQKVVEFCGYLFGQFSKIFYRLLHLRTWLRVRRIKRASIEAFDAAFPLAIDETYRLEDITMGIAPLEREKLGELINCKNPNRREFPPIGFRSQLPIPQALASWLVEARETPVVYVSFGSIVRLDATFVLAVYEALRSLPIRALWSISTEARQLLDPVDPAENIRLESFVPQPEVLQLPAVRCFVMQGGAPSTQESLLSGTPMVCIPFFSDQAYMSSVVEHLHVGKRLWKRDVSARSIARAVTDVLNTPSYARNAAAIRDKLKTDANGASIVSYVNRLPLP